MTILNEPNQTLLSGNNTISELPMKFSICMGVMLFFYQG